MAFVALVVRPTMAECRDFWVTCGLTQALCISVPGSAVSKPLSAPTVSRRVEPGEDGRSCRWWCLTRPRHRPASGRPPRQIRTFAAGSSDQMQNPTQP